ncbi:disease resistance protein RGA2-like [Cucumis melo var. makuwa]|uniref:Disease resistance protein RGA2-like n=1 Tax=Cucumis melo var. makuwa TaxID=1194695 RepID=A0A5A7UH43_CUCMM|nr:disease resistance protein RGA2-like [Cucumis melo var. makuwa]
MNNVRSIGNEFYGIESNNHRNSFALPKLEILDITWMEKVQQWDEATVNASNLFGSLKELSISNYKFSSFIHLPSQLVELELTDYGSDDNATIQLSQQLQHLTNLKNLRISGCRRNYEFGFFLHLSSQLIELELTDYGSYDNATTQLPQQLQLLTNLKILKISRITFKRGYATANQIKGIECLRRDCPEISSKEEQERAKLSDLPITLWVKVEVY